MSLKDLVGGPLDAVLGSDGSRRPAWKVYVWNPNRCSIHDVVLGTASSPRYDVTPWLVSGALEENIVFENAEDSLASTARLTFLYSPNASPIPITERTIFDGVPVRIYAGDKSVPESDWACKFTGVIRGRPTYPAYEREAQAKPLLVAVAVDRSEKYTERTITSRSYARGVDIGKLAVETAIEWCDLDVREISIGLQNYEIQAADAQLVDIAVLSGLYQMLFTVGKKPRFDGEGRLVAADTDLNRAPFRVHNDMRHVKRLNPAQGSSSGKNSVRLLGLSSVLTEVVEQEKRLAHGSIVSGMFESVVRQKVNFSEDTESTGGRRAKNTRGKFKIISIGEFFGENAAWVPTLESDGYTVFSGKIVFDTGADPAIFATALAAYVQAQIAVGIGDGLMGYPGTQAAGAIMTSIGEGLVTGSLVTLLLLISTLGKCDWEVWGYPFQAVYQQLCATAQAEWVLTEDLKEIEYRNDWLYEIDYMRARARELLKRELIKATPWEIEMLDDPLVEVDDILQIEDMRFYVTSISRDFPRPADGLMTLTAWRLA